MKILLPLDGSVYSKKAINYLSHLEDIKKFTNTVFLVNVQKKIPSSIENKLKNGVVEELQNAESRAILKPAKKKLEEAGYKVKSKVCFGRATENIVKVSKEIKPDLIIMGSHGRTPVKGLLFGSKTSSVLASTKAPMLVLRKESQYAEDRMRVGICIDGSEYSNAAIKYAQQHMQLFGKDPIFYLINVITPHSGLIIPEVSAFGAPAMTKEEFEREQRIPFDEKVEPIYEELRNKDIEAKVVLLKGDPSEEIAKYAVENNLSLLILGTHGRGAFTSMMMGSTAMRIGSACHLPLLLVHHVTEEVEESKNKDDTSSER